MNVFKSKKSILFLSGIILLLSMSQFIFPKQDVSEEEISREALEQIDIEVIEQEEIRSPEQLKETKKIPPKKSGKKQEQNKRKISSIKKVENTGSSDEFIKTLIAKETVDQLIEKIDHFEVTSPIVNVEEIEKNGLKYQVITYKDGSRVKQGDMADDGRAYSYANNFEKIVRNFYESGQIREYFYYDKDGHADLVSFYENGNMLYRHYRKDSEHETIRIYFNEDGTIKSVEREL